MMLRILLFSVLGTALLSMLIGYMGTRMTRPLDNAKSIMQPGKVVEASWPNVVVTNGTREWKLKYWPFQPIFKAGEEIEIAVDAVDENIAYLPSTGDVPVRYLALGGLVAVISIFGLAFTLEPAAKAPAGAMPQFPVTLHEPRVVAYVFLVFGGLCALGAVAAIIFKPSEASGFVYLYYLGALAFGSMLIWGGVHAISGKVVVTETEIVETSSVATFEVSLDQVIRIEQRPIYGEKLNRRLSGPDPIVGWTMVFVGADRSDLYTLSTALEPRDEYQKVINYLATRIPFETKK